MRIDLLIRSKSFEQVVRSCDALLAHGPVSEWALKRRALARSEINDYPGAIGDYTHLLALATDRAPLLRQRGALYLLLGTPRLALPDFEESIVLEPSNADGYNGRGTALVGLGWHRQAVDDADKALETARPTSRQLYKSARIYAQAAIVAGAQARNDGRDTVIIVATYQDRAVFLLREALKRLPADERGVFWRDTVLADPGLQTLRRRWRRRSSKAGWPSPIGRQATSGESERLAPSRQQSGQVRNNCHDQSPNRGEVGRLAVASNSAPPPPWSGAGRPGLREIPVPSLARGGGKPVAPVDLPGGHDRR